MKRKLLLILSSLCILNSQATDLYSVRSGSWFVPTNTWSPTALPVNGDNIYIITNHVNFDSTDAGQSVVVGNLSLTDAILGVYGPATLTMAGSANMFNGNNSLSGILYNQGSVFQIGNATLAISDSWHIENLAGGVYDFAGDGAIFGYSGWNPYFSNYGLLRKSAGAGAATNAVQFRSMGGTVQVDSGTLLLSGGGGSSNGTFIVAAGAALDLTGGNSST